MSGCPPPTRRQLAEDLGRLHKDVSVRRAIARAIYHQDVGQLDLAGGCMGELVRSTRGVAWAALLLALDSLEMRLGGGVTFRAPTAQGLFGPNCGIEDWGPIVANDHASGAWWGFEFIRHPVGEFCLKMTVQRERGAADAIYPVVAQELSTYLAIPIWRP